MQGTEVAFVCLKLSHSQISSQNSSSVCGRVHRPLLDFSFPLLILLSLFLGFCLSFPS